jgi:phage terminase large subunit-like protein
VNILEAIDDPALFKPWFRQPETWRAWRAFLASLFALQMTPDQREIYSACTGRQAPPTEPFGESWLVCGRRSGKSLTLALVSVFLACFRRWDEHLAPGERGTILVLASDRRQSRLIFRYARAFLEEVPLLADLVEKVTAEEIELSNRVTLEISAASFRSVRGYTVIAALCDETAYWRS